MARTDSVRGPIAATEDVRQGTGFNPAAIAGMGA
jgi:hypothetical protein